MHFRAMTSFKENSGISKLKIALENDKILQEVYETCIGNIRITGCLGTGYPIAAKRYC